MIFGKENNRGLVLEGFALKAVTIGEDGYTMDDILVHDAKNPNNVLHQMLAMMDGHELPLAIGVIRDVDAPNYTDELTRQIEEVKAKKNFKSLREYILSGDTWEVK
jgi:2-oxoglutarate ferredoxin oxidoreductase subunit beta